MRKKIQALWNLLMILLGVMLTAIFFLIQDINLRYLFMFSVLILNPLLQATFKDIIRYERIITKKILINKIILLIIGVFIFISPFLSTMKSETNLYFYILGIVICMDSIFTIIKYFKIKNNHKGEKKG
ncbi:MAG: DUF308 domain-containing protein [Promethearchaeota archaeon]